MNLFSRYTDEQLQRFKKFHVENKHIYREFKAKAKTMRAMGRRKYSARTIFEVMRWDYDVKTNHDEFKISNDFIPIYVRLLVNEDNSYREFFSLKGENE